MIVDVPVEVGGEVRSVPAAFVVKEGGGLRAYPVDVRQIRNFCIVHLKLTRVDEIVKYISTVVGRTGGLDRAVELGSWPDAEREIERMGLWTSGIRRDDREYNEIVADALGVVHDVDKAVAFLAEGTPIVVKYVPTPTSVVCYVPSACPDAVRESIDRFAASLCEASFNVPVDDFCRFWNSLDDAVMPAVPIDVDVDRYDEHIKHYLDQWWT